MLTDFYKNKRVLVTGGAGFIGSYLCERLVSYGAKVTILDNFSTGSHANIQHIKPVINIINDSIIDLKACKKAASKQNFVFHLAAQVSVPISVSEPLNCHDINVTGTINMLEAAISNNVKKFFFASSAAVYGNIKTIAQENMACNPLSPYGVSKLIGELYCKQYLNLYKLDTVIGRYFNVFGNRIDKKPRQDVTAFFERAIIEKRPISIFGDGSQSRDFIAVSDVVEKTLTLLAHSDSADNVYNIATGKSTTILELFYDLKRRTPDYTFEPSFLPARAGDTFHSRADCSKYNTLLSHLVIQPEKRSHNGFAENASDAG